MIIGIGYHYVRPDFSQPHPGIFGLTPEDFRTQLEHLGSLADFVGPDDLRAALRHERPLPQRAWLVTFDDGLREQYEYALPVLEQLKIHAFFFANTQPLAENKPVLVHMTHLLRSQVSSDAIMQAIACACVDLGVNAAAIDDGVAQGHYAYDTPDVARVKYLLNFGLPERNRQVVVDWCFDNLLGWDRADVCADLYMTRGQMTDLAKRGWLGTHTHTHRPLGTLVPEDAEADVRRSIDLLAEWTGFRVDAIGYPYGSRAACPPWLAEIGARLGLAMGFTMERAGIDGTAPAMLMPRCAPNDLPGGSTPRWPAAGLFDAIPASSWYPSNLP